MNDSHEVETDEQSVHFNLTFSLDRDGFMRRTCPSCGTDFKTEASASDFASELQPLFREVGLEIGGGEDKEDLKEYLICPYCRYRSEAPDMLTEELANYVRRLILREHVLPMVNKSLGQIANSFGSRRQNSLLSIKFEHNRPVLPVRPVSGPEPPDMMIIHMLCCGRRVKVYDGWYDLSRCPYCKTDTIIV